MILDAKYHNTMLASAIIGGVGAIGSAIYGAIASSEANNKARRLIQQQRNDNKRWYDVTMARDYTQRADVQAAIKRQRELLEEQYNNARKTNAVVGGTNEALAMQQAAANKSLSNTATDIAAQASNYKDSVERQYLAQDAALNQQQAQGYQQQAAATAQAASQAVNAGLGLVGQGLHEAGIRQAELAAEQAAADQRAAARQQAISVPASLEAEMKSNLGTTAGIGAKIPRPAGTIDEYTPR